MSKLVTTKGPSIGFKTLEDDEIVELSLRSYRGMDATQVVRSALEQGVGARETAEILKTLGFGEFNIGVIIEARATLRAELAEEFAITKPQAKAMLLRRSELIIARLLHDFNLGATKHARELRGMLELQSKLYGLDKNEDGLTERLREELDKVSAERSEVLDIPKAHDSHQSRVEAALAKHAEATIYEED